MSEEVASLTKIMLERSDGLTVEIIAKVGDLDAEITMQHEALTQRIEFFKEPIPGRQGINLSVKGLVEFVRVSDRRHRQDSLADLSRAFARLKAGAPAVPLDALNEVLHAVERVVA